MSENFPKPPKWPDKLLSWFCTENVLETLQGDLHELYAIRSKKIGPFKAGILFFLDVLSALRPFAFKKFKRSKNTFWIMINHNLLVARRNIWKNKAYSLINIFGLIIGLSAALLLGKYVGYTKITDNFHEQRDQIFLVNHKESEGNVVKINHPATYRGFGNWAQQQFPEVINSCKFTKHVEKLVTTQKQNGENVKFNEQGIYVADTSFFSIFSFNFTQGNAKDALQNPNSVVITADIAQKYFGTRNVVGQSFTTSTAWGEKQQLNVTGVIESIPKHSSLQFDFLISNVGDNAQRQWQFADAPTYLLVDNEASIDALVHKINKDINDVEALVDNNKTVAIALQSLGKPEFSKVKYLLILVGIFTLLITWINFINLSTAQITQRIKETGVRKALGSNKTQLIAHFLIQGIILNGIGLLAAIVLSWTLYPYLSAFTNGQLLAFFWDPSAVNIIFLSSFFIGAIISSLYPSFIVTAVNPVKALKGKFTNVNSGTGFRKLLVIAQFSIAIILIIGVVVIFQQMQYIQDQTLGINLDRTLVIKSTKDGWDNKLDKFATFKNKVRQLSMVEAAASSTTVPGSGAYQTVLYTVGKSDKKVISNLMGIDKHYVDYFNLKLLAGKTFSDYSFRSSRKSIIINKSAAISMGFDDYDLAIDQKITHSGNGKTLTIIGVIDDFHQKSLKEKIPSMTFDFNPFRGNIVIRLDSLNYKNYKSLGHSIAAVEKIWEEIYPDQSFDYYFLDEYFNAQYLTDIKFKKIFTLFSTVSVLIACLGLFGLSIHIATKRRKEVGIRKVHGASSIKVVYLFCKDYLVQVVTAIIIGTPVAYLLMHKWLESYSYRTTITIWTLVAPAIILVLISLFTISFQTIKASTVSPATTLKDE